MKYSKATNYALHTMVFLALTPSGKTIGVRPLAEIQKVSPTYLSKVLTKLVKAGFVESAPGVNGGYKIVKNIKDISFLEIIHAIEGSASLFNCSLNNDLHNNHNCLIQEVMEKAERKMEEHLKEQTLLDIIKKVDDKIISHIRSESR
ncbi:Rrf2 family transcriptional regulator [Fredinandcohnia sp. FSL W7-1320]|uniref:Rrf2 family transcriptional regulator n=1 Tax=Fredinandcohnia sp. FSL W7-1320 TaxID=2954540 RepID=UPI0030FD3D89